MFVKHKHVPRFVLVTGQGQGHRSKFFLMSGKPLSQGTYMPNMKVLSQRDQKLWPMLIFPSKQVTSQGQRSNFLCEWEALVTRNLHAKYEGSILNRSKVMTNVFFKVGQRSRPQVSFLCVSGKPMSQGT